MIVLEEIEALKRRLGVTSDAEFAALLGMQRSTIAQWKKRGAIPVSSRAVIDNLLQARGSSALARAAVSKLPASERQLCRAIALKYLIVSTEEGDLEPDYLLWRVLAIDELELAASRLLEDQRAINPGDSIAAYRAVLDRPDFETALTCRINGASRDGAIELPQ